MATKQSFACEPSSFRESVVAFSRGRASTYGLLYRIDQSESLSRDEWQRLPFNQQHREALEKARRGGPASWETVKAALKSLMSAIFSSPDLTPYDARRLSNTILEQVQRLHQQATDLAR